MKTITNVVLNTSTLPPEAQTLPISIYGDENAVFSLIVKKGATHWYDFNASPSAFVTSEKILSNITIDPSGFYNTNINIPAVTGTTNYTFLIIADTASDTVHAQRNEIRNSDGSINENASTGSDSAVLSRTITQITNTTITFKGISHGSSGTYSSVGSDAIEVPVTGSNTPINFTISVTLGSSDFVKVRDPNDGDFSALKSAVVQRITEDEETGANIYIFSDDEYGTGFLSGMQVRHSNISGGVTKVGTVYDSINGISFVTTEGSVAVENVLKFYTTSNAGVQKINGSSLSFSNLSLSLADVSTTVNDSDANGSDSLTTFTVASADGIKDDTSTLHGVNIVGTPTVTNISGADLTIGAGQVLENTQAVIFRGASRAATITGTVVVPTVGTSNFNMLFNLDNVLTVS
tara:strand:+ start:9120 stop:10337 length:1218 start_codon:yes stop_codon:yes gene_type:complete